MAPLWWYGEDLTPSSPGLCVLGLRVCIETTYNHNQLTADLQQVEPETCWLRGRVIRPGGAAAVPTEKHMSGINTYRQKYRLAYSDH